MTKRERKPQTWQLARDKVREWHVGWTNPSIVLYEVSGKNFVLTQKDFSGTKKGIEYIGVPQMNKKHLSESSIYSRLLAIEGTQNIYQSRKTTIREVVETTGLEVTFRRLKFEGGHVRKTELALRNVEALIECYAFAPKGWLFARPRTLNTEKIVEYLSSLGMMPLNVGGKQFYTAYQADQVRESLTKMAEEAGLEIISNNLGVRAYDAIENPIPNTQ